MVESVKSDKNYDLVIIGGGYAGAWSAYLASRQLPGYRIALIDKAGTGSGASLQGADLDFINNSHLSVMEASSESRFLFSEAHKEIGLPLEEVNAYAIGSGSGFSINGLSNLSKDNHQVTNKHLAGKYPWLKISEPISASGPVTSYRANSKKTIPLLLKAACDACQDFEVMEDCLVSSVVFNKDTSLHEIRTGKGNTLLSKTVITAAGPWLLTLPWIAQFRTNWRIKKIVSFFIDIPPFPGADVLYFLDEGAFLMPVHEEQRWLLSITSKEWDCSPDNDFKASDAEWETASDILKNYAPDLLPFLSQGRVFCDSYSTSRCPEVLESIETKTHFLIGGCSGSGYRLAPSVARKAVAKIADYLLKDQYPFAFDSFSYHLHDKVAIHGVAENTAITYSMLLQGNSNLEARLAQLNIPQGSVISISCRGRLNQAIYLFCGLNLPYIFNPLNPEYKTEEIVQVLAHSGSKLVITDYDFPLKNKDIVILEADVASLCVSGKTDIQRELNIQGKLLIYTSGTTGNPKGVLLSPEQINKNTREAVQAFGYTSDSVSGSLLPLFHTFTLISDLIPLLRVGGTCVVFPAFSALEAKIIQEGFRKFRVNSFSAVPVIFKALNLLFEPADMENLRFAVAGAAPLLEQTQTDFYNKFQKYIIPCFGLSETTCFATITPLTNIKPRAVGKPAGIDIRIADQEGVIQLQDNTIGEIVMKGDSVIDTGYFKDMGRAGVYTREGYFRSGDIGYFDEDRYLYIVGRKKNMIIRGGKKVYLEDVDRCLQTLGWIKDCASIAIVKEGAEDQAVTFIVPDNRQDEKEVMHYLITNLSSLHVPDRVEFINEIPRTKTGKPQIEKLKSIVSTHAH